jgi:hypothetical protein
MHKLNARLETPDAVSAVLRAEGRSEEIPESADAYGWLVGSWELDVLHYWAIDVSAQGMAGEVHAHWVLEGHAVQDVWIMPARSERKARLDKTLNMYGTTLRVWDPIIHAWRITWRNPAGDHHEDQIGRRSGKDVVQIGVRPDGTPTRWRFAEITPNSFHWLGESLGPDGKTWKLEGEFRGRRTITDPRSQFVGSIIRSRSA